MIEVLKQIFPQLNDEKFLTELLNDAKLLEYPKGTEIIKQGDRISYIPLVTKGEIKIFRVDSNGNGLYLYSLYRGDICAMSVSCCINNNKSNLHAVAAVDVEFFAIPAQLMNNWIANYKVWRAFVFDNYRKKFDELIDNISSIAFLNLKDRLLKFLVIRSEKSSGIIRMTHQEIANELNSSREVISRQLKQLEEENKIKLLRNHIWVLKR
ncbi:MAG TPA: Crp/Fnr family transcriptional regulator [Bacteroidales bacterium]|nr:Crp/Fnr family transcriptional regulator [Bacteroidales bacterium]HPD24743.1 Crp/Fnr family transcriptional regulator [Bacteroidales bacterium]HRT00488.1 Crp/Fnr family transcriptional regulator [Bacteroidales bacterium]HRT81127.1 Crp/Fnr family transcriptional regulator [Bacteroidales bacterium]